VDRSAPIRMSHHLPSLWAGKNVHDLQRFSGHAQPGEKFTFQVGVATGTDITVLTAEFSDLVSASADVSSSRLRCMNLQGIDFWSRPYQKNVTVQADTVLPLWMILEVPTDASGVYSGNVTLHTTAGVKVLPLQFTVSGPVLADRGDGDIWRGTRLAWLDSTLGNEDDVPPPFYPVSVSSNTVSLLDKVVSIGDDGLLGSVQVGGIEALAAPIRFEILIGGNVVTIPTTRKMGETKNLTVAWEAAGSAHGVDIHVSGSLDATGYADFVVSTNVTEMYEARLVIEHNGTNAIYGAGTGRAGGFLTRWFDNTSSVDWKWDGQLGNNALWIGSTACGLRVKPKGSDPLWQAGVPFDNKKSPTPPESWSNAGAGGIQIFQNGTTLVYTGVRQPGHATFLFSLMATPTRPLNLPKHFSERYAHRSGPANYSELKAGGASVVVMHQGNVLNPWINYPYLTNGLLKQAADECHKLNMKFKVYNTMRELSSRATELWAMRAFNETYVTYGGTGNGGDWLREHIDGDYSVAWATPMAQSGFWSQQDDQAIKVNAMSRWNNYYVEGLRQIKQDFGNDGMYLDEIAYDRVTIRRAKSVLGEGGLIDHHSDRGGFTTVPAVNYMELFPFVDSLWYGEGFDYDAATPDFWLVEMSGIPFGLNSDMLRYDGMTPFHFRGMLVASSNRWQDNLLTPGDTSTFDPRAVWALWDSFNISAATMHGWWASEEGHPVPIVSNSSDVKCTSFVHYGRTALIVLANFGSAQNVQLSFDWEMLGLEEDAVALRAPVMKPMQPQARSWSVSDCIPVPAPQKGSPDSKEGWMILLEPKPVVEVHLI